LDVERNIAALKKQGRSLEVAVAAKPTKAFDERWGQFVISPEMFTGLVCGRLIARQISGFHSFQ
jgi:hypothetical protein